MSILEVDKMKDVMAAQDQVLQGSIPDNNYDRFELPVNQAFFDIHVLGIRMISRRHSIRWLRAASNVESCGAQRLRIDQNLQIEDMKGLLPLSQPIDGQDRVRSMLLNVIALVNIFLPYVLRSSLTAI